MVTEDWMMRQVETMARSIAMLVFHKEDTTYVPTGDAEADGLHRELMRRLEAAYAAGKTCCLRLPRRVPRAVWRRA